MEQNAPLLSLVLRSAKIEKSYYLQCDRSFQSSPSMHVEWSYCKAAGFVAKRKTNQLDTFKKEESAGTQRI